MWTRLWFAGALAATLALAQDPGGGGGMGGGGGRGGGGGMDGLSIPNAPRIVNRIDMISESLKLDKEQKKSVKNMLDEGQKEANPVREQLAKARLAIGEAVKDGKPQDEINGLVTNEAQLESQMADIELSSFAKIYKGLQQEQRSQTRMLYMMMRGIFSTKNWNVVE
jgi:hypothetical protein